jgi:hypothetical protein
MMPRSGSVVASSIRRTRATGNFSSAADKTGRVCRGVELDPLYVDVVVRRYEPVTDNPAVLVDTGEAFDPLRGRRSRDAAPA